jgi:methyltransferase family protein
MLGTGLLAPIYRRLAAPKLNAPVEPVAPPHCAPGASAFWSDLDRACSAWRETMAPHGHRLGHVDRFPEAPALQPHHLVGAKLFADRWVHLESLPAGGVCAEVGVHTGDYSAEILRRARPQSLHLIDIDLHQFSVRERFASEAAAGIVHFHEGHSVDMLNGFPAAYFDWIYIDADHRYEGVRADATVAAAKLKPRGLLIFNDYIFWSYKEAMLYGIVRVVNEMCVNEGWRVSAFCFSNIMYCDIAITRA